MIWGADVSLEADWIGIGWDGKGVEFMKMGYWNNLMGSAFILRGEPSGIFTINNAVWKWLEFWVCNKDNWIPKKSEKIRMNLDLLDSWNEGCFFNRKYFRAKKLIRSSYSWWVTVGQ